jgi:hypothetical protein
VIWRERGDRGRERVGACRRRHRHGEDVVGEKRHAGHLRREQAEVVARDHVRAARRRVLLDRLAVGQDQEEQHDEQRRRDRQHEAEGEDPDYGQKDPQDLFGCIRRRRDAVR